MNHSLCKKVGFLNCLCSVSLRVFKIFRSYLENCIIPAVKRSTTVTFGVSLSKTTYSLANESLNWMFLTFIQFLPPTEKFFLCKLGDTVFSRLKTFSSTVT